MKKGIYTVIFMVAVSAVFIAALAYVNAVTRARIAQNIEMQRLRSVLYASDLLPNGVEETALPPTSTTEDMPWDEENILRMMEERVRTIRLPVAAEQRRVLASSFLSVGDSVEIALFYGDAGLLEAFGFPLKGKGLWGTISAYGVISADLDRMVGIDFTEQVETPGLGARITEQEFKYFFRDLDLTGFGFSPESPPIVMVGRKERSNREASTNSVQAITGATQTCNGVLNMLNTDLRFYIRLLSENKARIEAFHRM